MLDVLIAGAGPAGSLAALVLARAGVRVLLVDRARFPRDKLCGDTVNPGAMSLLRSLGLDDGPLAGARPLAGMRLTGPGRSVVAQYGDGQLGRALVRRDLDAWLLERAIAAGAKFRDHLLVREPLIDGPVGSCRVRGLALAEVGGGSRPVRMPATLTIAADGARSRIARALGLAHAPAWPRRWAYGTYVQGVAGTDDFGEMHVRAGAYLGIAPVSDQTANVCVVTAGRPSGPDALGVIRNAIAADPELADRFRAVRLEARHVRVLGPLAVDAPRVGTEGLLLAGDAAGFIDPITGDGLHLALRGGLLAADEALRILHDGQFAEGPRRLAEARRRMFGRKIRFNRAVRRLVDSPRAIDLAALGAAVWPELVRRAVRYAGDAT
jgi:flavin-dependent dehydrogenase